MALINNGLNYERDIIPIAQNLEPEINKLARPILNKGHGYYCFPGWSKLHMYKIFEVRCTVIDFGTINCSKVDNGVKKSKKLK